MSGTLTAMNEFAKTVKEHATKRVGDPEEIREKILRCKAANPPVFEEKEVAGFLKARAKTLKTLIGQYVLARLSAHYPVIDEKLFDLNRFLYFKKGSLVADDTKARKESGARAEKVRLFAYCSLENPKDTLAKFSYLEGGRLHPTAGYWVAKKRHTIEVTATLPKPPAEVLVAGRKALGVYHKLVGDLLTDTELGELYDESEAAFLAATWIPTATSLSVKIETKELPRPLPAPATLDPALLLEVPPHVFLVTLWDAVDEEEPFEHYLREFSKGSAKIEKVK
jgi:hypothetical protein